MSRVNLTENEWQSLEMIWCGLDFGSSDHNTEIVCRKNGDGTLTLLDINTWKHDIDHVPFGIHNNGTSKGDVK